MSEDVEVNKAWLYQSYSKDKCDKLAEEDPFIEVEGQVAVRVGYVYNVWSLGGGKRICIRSTIHGYLPDENLYAQAEYDEAGEEI